MKSPLPRRIRNPQSKASVLLISLAFILLMTVISVAFLVRSRISLQTSDSYSKELIAQELGELGADKLVADFQKEINTAIAGGTNLLLPPQGGGITNTDVRNNSYVRRTQSLSGSYPTTTASKNGWLISDARWKVPAFVAPATAFTAPEWVYVDKQVSGSVTVGDVVGRYAAAVYDVSGMLDVNETGTSLPTGDKGSTIFADLSAINASLTNAGNLVSWRGATATLTSYYGDTNYSAVNYANAVNPASAGRLETPTAAYVAGENLFFSRMELVQAANKNQLGLTAANLPYLRTRSKAANRVTLEDVYANGTSALTALTDASLAATADRIIPVTRINGVTENITIKSGKPFLQNLFPLARLRWLASRQANGTPNFPVEIKRHFGLTWDAALKGFIYTSPDSGVAVNSIKTLAQVVALQSREPDFFEWLKGGINPDSLGKTGGSTDRMVTDPGTGIPFLNGTLSVPWEASKDLHILRIGANIIDQSDPDSIPTPIRSTFTNVTPNPFDSFGAENIPYLNEVVTSVLRNGANLEGYLQFEMWNPNRNSATQANPPRDFQGNAMSNFRVRAIKGRVAMEPFVYVKALANASPAPPNYKIKVVGQSPPTQFSAINETLIGAWNSLRRITEYSQNNILAASFVPPGGTDIAGTSVNFTLNAAGEFFAEPYLANGAVTNNCQDTANADAQGGTVAAFLGASPSAANAMRVCTVTAPNPAIPAGTLSLTNIYTDANGDPIGTTPSLVPAGYTASPLANKNFNAVMFTSDGLPLKGISTEPVTLAVEVQDDNNVWHTCQIYNDLAMDVRANIGRMEGAMTSGADTTRNQSQWLVASPAPEYFSTWTEWTVRKGYNNSDPRTERFGFSNQVHASPGASIRTHTSPWAGNGITWNLSHGLTTSVGTSFAGGGIPANEGAAPGWALVSAGAPQVSIPADLALNTGVAGSHYYSDADAVVRPADARFVPATEHPALPVAGFAGAVAARPGMLNRPFRSVAELGTVFRDVPWKSLDLFSPASADRRLLDIFSLTDSSTVSGKINPNLTQNATLRAILLNTSLEPANATTAAVSSTDANAVAGAISGLNPTTIVDQVTSLENLAERINTGASSSPMLGDAVRSYKPRVENYLRALSSTSDTRSWQLVFDVIAQSGKIAPGSASLTDFIVAGQRRFFVYLTMDRLTGEVVDKQIEPVYE